MGVDGNTLAPAVATRIENTQFKSEATNLPRKILVIAGFDETVYTTTIPGNVYDVLSAENAGALCGFGDVAYRMVQKTFIGAGNIPVFLMPLANSTGVKATGQIDFSASASVEAGTMHLYLAADHYEVLTTLNMTPTAIASAVVAAVNAVVSAPVVASSALGVVTFTAKSQGEWGNDISIAFSLGRNEALPSGVVGVITGMASGSGTPNLATALAGLGEGDDANGAHFTDVVHAFGMGTTELDAIADYVGAGNTAVGLFADTIARPFRVIHGDTTLGTAGYAALKAISDVRLQDRMQGVISVPASKSHPLEIAAQAMGIAARINERNPEGTTIGQALVGVHTPYSPASGDVWSSSLASRDAAIKAGITPTLAVNGTVYMQGLISFYRPATVPVNSNGYRSMRNFSIIQNILYNDQINFKQDRWVGFTVVADVAKVLDTDARLKVRDINSVLNDKVALAEAFEQKAWIYSADFTIDELKKAGAVTIRSNGTGFDSTMRVIFSGEGGILNSLIQFDVSLSTFFG